MFDIGFWEICLIAVIALLVIGPEKLPSAARTAGLWVGRMRSFITTMKQDVDRELKLQEMQDAIKQSEQHVHQIVDDMGTGMEKLNRPITDPFDNEYSDKNSSDNKETDTTLPDNSVPDKTPPDNSAKTSS
ncbi:Sec-independent protein translocase protein TatB [Candidatus Halobeggiatoa sp. HSG11]|nr:Sec-independent protein translocase protein TatB [Candidatus Halobeggiatoa sp. HSG11]